MVIILTGGGSGGHITPLLAVAEELKKQRPDIQLIYIGQKGDKLADVPAKHPSIDKVYTIRSGKFRRYHGEAWRLFFDVPTMAKNVRDFWYVLVGSVQSYRLLKRLKPAVVFSRGGFVSVPVGWAAGMQHIPYVTHDSDALPSLANRLIGRRAALHAVALPKEIYPYPPDKTFTVGIPISDNFRAVSTSLASTYKHEIGLERYEQIIFVTGGGLGAKRLNQAVAMAVPELLRDYPKLAFVHVVGRDHETSVQALYDKNLVPADRPRAIVKGFIHDLYRYSGAADIVIARAGATNLAEFAAQGRACIIVPNPQLSGGHQVKNAQVLASHHAALILEEEELVDHSEVLGQTVRRLLDDSAGRRKLGEQMSEFAYPDATKRLVGLILGLIK